MASSEPPPDSYDLPQDRSVWKANCPSGPWLIHLILPQQDMVQELQFFKWDDKTIQVAQNFPD